MEKIQARPDDFKVRRIKLANLSDAELKNYFWELAKKTTDPLVEMAFNHTTPAIERSILLRMGFSSHEAKALVDKVIDYQLIGKGAGGVVYRYATITKQDIREAGLALINDLGWPELLASYGRVKS